MQHFLTQLPYKIIVWHDSENTGAVGWIVIHNLINHVSGGGLFMHETASLQEVKDLAYTMSLKNALQQPMFGGGKGGIRFDPLDARAPDVLKRFLKDNIDVIATYWCTGGDINTTTHAITQSIRTISDIKSPFKCLANMLQKNLHIQVSTENFQTILDCYENEFFKLNEAITGYSVFKTLENEVQVDKPKIAVQGFGKVGKAFCYYAHQKYSIVAICEKDWFIYDENGIDIERLLSVDVNVDFLDNTFKKVSYRNLTQTAEDFLVDFLSQVKVDVFSPCATRYCITSKILKVLTEQTFANSKLKNPLIVAGANDIFSNKALVAMAFHSNIVVLPEWLSNAGSALLFVEAFKNPFSQLSNIFIKQCVADRIISFLTKAKHIANEYKINIYAACVYLANLKLNSEQLCELSI